MPRSAAGRGAESSVTGAPFFFEGIESPNGTIFPDALLDQVMPFLSPTEWKVCSYIVRRTFGWKKASDRISLEQICHGIVRRDGSRLDHGTQLDRKTAIKALRGLEAKGVIVAQRNYSDARGYEATSYGLRFRGQTPTRTLGEKIPLGGDGVGENLPQGPGEPLPEAPREDFPQASGAHPPALVVSGHPQPTSGTTIPATTNDSNQSNQQRESGDEGLTRLGLTDGTPEERAAAVSSQTPHGTPGPNGARSGQSRLGESLAATAGTGAGGEGVLASPPLPGMERTTSEADAGIWAAVLARLEQQMTAANYQTWLADTRPLGRRGATLVVGAPSGFVRDWLQTRFRALVRRALQDVAPALTDVTFAIAPGGEH
ncbi:MAG TPA: DnaA N-terminal domain-containing protein [Chloroflexota bacterium]|nr:DnaA N-terminal domain-containing protein [Chloroflexota bacterium]